MRFPKPIILTVHACLWLAGLMLPSSGVFANEDDAAQKALQQAIPVRVTLREADSDSARCAVLIHGLARLAGSMSKLSQALNKAGWHTANVDYPSRKHTVEALASGVVFTGVSACRAMGATRIDAVTHSLGGILMRQFLKDQSIDGFARLVMLGPPNHGSEVVDALRDVPGFVAFNGPAGLELGTGDDSVPNMLGPIEVDTAIIAGTASINLLLSNFLPNPDDGKVSVASARLQGMCAMMSIHVSHPFLIKNDASIEQVIAYLSDGKFKPVDDHTPEYPACGHRYVEP